MSSAEMSAATIPLPTSARIAVSDQVVVRISGAGTDKFLQGQFSQQVTDVTEQYSPRAAACSPKGRAYCLTRMVREGNDVLIALPSAFAGETIAHLRKYLMLFRGTSMAVEEDALIIGLLGEKAAGAFVDDATTKLPLPGDTFAVNGGHLIRSMDALGSAGVGRVPRFELWQTSALAADSSRLLDEIDSDTLATWQASEIAAGVPSLRSETRESYVPQMLNWQHLGGVHFKKGCYTGQEVIARMHFLGQLKKSLFRFASPQAAGAPSPGAGLVNNGRSVGEVVNSVQFKDGTFEGLAVIRHDAAGDGLTLKQSPDLPLTLRPLPYEVTEREQEIASDT